MNLFPSCVRGCASFSALTHSQVRTQQQSRLVHRLPSPEQHPAPQRSRTITFLKCVSWPEPELLQLGPAGAYLPSRCASDCCAAVAHFTVTATAGVRFQGVH